MRYRLFGRSGLRVSELCLGTMTFGEDWGWGASREESRRMFDAFAEAGGNFVDTANNYTNGTAERFVGEFVASDRDHFVVATKYTLSERPEDPNFGGNHRKNLMRSLEGSLRRLATDHVDVLWLHMWDGTTPVEEVLRAMDDVVRAGKVLYVGLSDTPAWVVSRAVATAELRGWTAPVAVQVPYSIADRAVEREELPMARALGLAVAPWGMLEGGVLTGKYLTESGELRRYGDHQPSEAETAAAQAVRTVAGETGATASQVAMAWVRRQPGTIIPILGARTEVQLKDNLGVLELTLSDEQAQKLNDATGFSLGFPRGMLESDMVRGLIFGTTYEQIHR
jgi:aryl-alcohol dehydrogenase-like predicted oxidoreductase